MGNVLANISKDNTHFTVFENDQVLTADQLNDLFNYLDIQTRLTRTKAIGVGILFGLEIGILDNNNIVLSQGCAITTDGDLLNFDSDQEFDLFEKFEDTNARYPYFRNQNDLIVDIYELKSSNIRGVSGQGLSGFNIATGANISEFVGIVYLEDYRTDPDTCTGTDCDNKGAESVRDAKVLLIHKDNMKLLQGTIPDDNKNYFALTDILVPRAIINTAVNSPEALTEAFAKTLNVINEIKVRLTEAYKVCQPMLDGEFEDGDPTTSWSNLLDEHVKIGKTVKSQYVYDFARDLSQAYNELRETLFSSSMLSSPDVGLFPKHVIAGLTRKASISNALQSPLVNGTLLTNNIPLLLTRLNTTSSLLTKVRFNLGSTLRRFNPVQSDVAYRHSFYESPIANNQNALHTRFCFRRIDAMIRNFKVPEAQTAESIVITPSHYENRPLGDRSIPYYYNLNTGLPINLFWSYSANTRKKENDIFYYHTNASPLESVFNSNILGYEFFRIEGHLGLKYQDVETKLNALISQYNLPINLITVQLETTRDTVKPLPWHFPHLEIYENSIRNTLFDHMNQVDLYNKSLKEQVVAEPAENINKINLAVANYDNAQSKVFANKPITHPEFSVMSFKADIGNVIKAATEVKVQTKEYDFSHAAAPHDFLINTDILHKLDLYEDLVKQNIDLKKDGLIMSNFLKQNPGMEHAGGVLRGGTFVLVYTTKDESVVGDFMLPYASIDKDIVPDPPVVKPIPLPTIPKLELPKVFEKIPKYKQFIDDRIKPIDTRFIQIEDKFKPFDDKIRLFDNAMTDRISTINGKLDAVDQIVKTRLDAFSVNVKDKLENVDRILMEKTTAVDSKLKGMDSIIDTRFKDILYSKSSLLENPKIAGLGEIIVGGKDLNSELNILNTRKKEVESLAQGSPERIAKEKILMETASSLSELLNEASKTASEQDATAVKAVLYDIQDSTLLVSSQANADALTKIKNNVNIVNSKVRNKFTLR